MPRPYEIVSFYAQYGKDRPTVAPDLDIRMINIMVATARASGDAVNFTLLTNPRSELPGLDPAIAVTRSDLDVGGLMLARAAAQTDYVDRFDFRTPIALLDTDIVVNGPIGALFEEDFDVAFCYRPHKKQPINAGVIFLNNKRPEAVRQFMHEWLAAYRSDFAHQGQWWGDQASLNAMVEVPAGVTIPSDIRQHGTIIRLLDARIWNRAPMRIRWQSWFPKRKSLILHFKSSKRKPDMIRFYERWFQASARR